MGSGDSRDPSMESGVGPRGHRPEGRGGDLSMVLGAGGDPSIGSGDSPRAYRTKGGGVDLSIGSGATKGAHRPEGAAENPYME